MDNRTMFIRHAAVEPMLPIVSDRAHRAGRLAGRDQPRYLSQTRSERPVIFNGAMSLAVVELRKTVTRRPLALKHQGHDFARMQDGYPDGLRAVFAINDDADYSVRSPFGMPGDKLWVRECFVCTHAFAQRVAPDEATAREWQASTHYRADYASGSLSEAFPEGGWKPSIHMPRWASRTVLDVLDVRVERLQSMSEEDARAEGVDGLESSHPNAPARMNFATLWDGVYPAMRWSTNPWVWRIEFKRAA